MAENKEPDIERRVFEVRRTTMVPNVIKERFVFECIDNEWHATFAAATKYSLTQMKEIIATMAELPNEEKEIEIGE